MQVAPCFIPKSLSGPYWVVNFSVEEDWALVSGGPPNLVSGKGCKTGSGENDSGLWIFTRAQHPSLQLLDRILALASARGFDTSVLDRIDHSGCAATAAQ